MRVVWWVAMFGLGLSLLCFGETATMVFGVLAVGFCLLALIWWVGELEGRVKSLEYNVRVATDMAKDRDE